MSDHGRGTAMRSLLSTLKKPLTRRRRTLYKRLRWEDSVRILVIEPGGEQDRLVCRLQVCRINHSPLEYEALSYVWGSVEDKVDIVCNGHVIKITRNLGNALQKVRLPNRSRRIWADAVCINQGDIVERGHQVRLMGLIYKIAKRVIIWVGRDENQNAPAAFSLMSKIVNREESNADNLSYVGFDPCRYDAGVLQGHHLPLMSSSDWESLKAFYKIPWLRRLWVLQEVVLSSSAVVVWGDSEISWDIVGLASDRIQDNHRLWNAVDQRTGIGNAYLMHSLRNPTRALYSFRILLQRSRRFEATDPKDRIFAVLGLPTTDTFPDNGQLFLEPDYTLSISQLYLKVARRMIEQEQNLGLLSAVQHGSDIEEGIPTWVPRWNRFSINILAGVDGKSHSVATGLPKHQVRSTHKDPGSLMVQGLELDIVTNLTDTMSQEDFKATEVHDPSSDLWSRRVERLFGEHTESNLKALGWTMTAGKDWADEPIRDPASHLADFAAWWSKVSSHTLDVGARASAETGGAERFLVAASDCWGRRLFVTKKCYLGLGPEALHEGDLVCVLARGPVPYILRKRNEHYYSVGESYVYGMMGHEAVQQWRERNLTLRDFELR